MAKVKTFILGVKNRIQDDRLSLVAASVAFYVFLSIFPMLAVAVSIYGLALDPQSAQNQVDALGSFVPKDVLNVLSARIEDLATTQNQSLTLGVVGGILISLWSANRAMKAVAKALNIAYDTREHRGFIKFNAVTLALTLASSLAFIVALTVVVFVPILINAALASRSASLMTTIGSWLVFSLFLTGVFLVIYHYAPSLHRSWRNLLPGTVTAAVLFIIVSAGFSVYVANFGEYDKQYGALGAVVVTMLWLYLAAFVFLFGAEITAQQHQNREERPRVHDKPGT